MITIFFLHLNLMPISFFMNETNFYSRFALAFVQERLVKDNPKIDPDDFKNALEIKYTGVRETDADPILDKSRILPTGG